MNTYTPWPGWEQRQKAFGGALTALNQWCLTSPNGLDELTALVGAAPLPGPFPSALKNKAPQAASSPRLREAVTDHLFGFCPIGRDETALRNEIARRFRDIPLYLYSAREMVLKGGRFVADYNKMLINIGRLVLRNGACMEIRGAALVDIGQLVVEEPRAACSLVVRGPDGMNGKDGLNGRQGTDGAPGRDAACDCCGGRVERGAEPGGPGEAGEPGERGHDGLKGIRTFPAVIRIGWLNAPIAVLHAGGRGGHGGRGGAGGDGGRGGRGGTGVLCGRHEAAAARDGPPGDGGRGGDGGAAGDGGNGGRVVIYAPGGSARVRAVNVRALPGEGGRGGAGGRGGSDGRPGATGKPGKEGLTLILDNAVPFAPCAEDAPERQQPSEV